VAESELQQHAKLVVVGDFNIAPADADVHDPVAWKDSVLCSPAERAAFHRLLDLGLCDSFRNFEQPETVSPGGLPYECLSPQSWFAHRSYLGKHGAV